uniref:Peptidase aspartic putative domain-containing protein n=1 Tax=Plectus sambesii TaxID=2011161 RepID=A0A914W323_9BILA
MRLKKVADYNMCPRCLGAGHSASQCNYKRPCFFCRENHNSALCPGKTQRQGPQSNGGQLRGGNERPMMRNQAQRSNGAATTKVMAVTEMEMNELEPDEEGPVLQVNAALYQKEDDGESSKDKESPKKEVLLLSKEVTLSNPKEPERQLQAIAFFDVGSQLSFITEDVAKKLKLVPNGQENIAISTFAAKKPTELQSLGYKIDLKQAEGTIEMRVSLVKKLTDHIMVPIEDAQHEYTTSLQGKRMRPSILIGADYFWEVVNASEARKLPSGFHMIDSKIGPLFCGKGHMASIMVIQQREAEKNKIEEMVEKFWKLEAIGVNDNPEVDDDEVALQQFQNSVKIEDGRYVVKWPWKENIPELPSNYTLCMARLMSTLKRLKEQPDLLQKYDDIMKEQLQKGIIEPVEDLDQHSGIVHYLPHHPVITPNKATTKVRIVYNASARARRGAKSLNDCLYRGPLLLPDLCGMLMRFRTYEIAIMADVEKAFLQLGLEEADRGAVRFIWLKDIKEPWSQENVQVYQFCQVAFGVISSPFILAATIRHHLRQSGEKVAYEIEENVYADNVLMEATSTKEAQEKCRMAKKIFKDALMNLREFTSNDQLINAEFADEGQKETVKFLGIPWNTRRDVIMAQLPPVEESGNYTKRQVLKIIASIYDPLGLLAPAVLPAKQFFQELWMKEYSWDQRLSEEDEKRWKRLTLTLADRTIQLPRRLFKQIQEGELEIHTFVDASAIAYAAAVYVKQKTKKEGMVALVYTKSRLCPIKKMTIPRLELMAATIGARMTKFVRQQLQKPIQNVTLWSDSKCVLGWINSKSETLPKFVSNRLQEIWTLEGANFRYVPTQDNPADLGSRGVTVEELRGNALWWSGPKWLLEEEDKWPPTPIINPKAYEKEDESEEMEERTVAAMTVPLPPIIKIERWGSWQKALVVMSMVLWLIKSTILNKVKAPLSTFWKRLKEVKAERNSAEMIALAREELLRQAQRTHPPGKEDMEAVNKKEKYGHTGEERSQPKYNLRPRKQKRDHGNKMYPG